MPPATSYTAEISRKVLHLTAVITPLVYLFIERGTMLCLLGPCTALAVLIELPRHMSPRFEALFQRCVGFMVRRQEHGRVTGATYVMVGALLSVWLFPKPIAIAVLLIQVISDTAASMIGLRFGHTRFLGKSLAGSGAFFVTAVAILWIAWPAARGIGLLAALIATIAEALPSLRFARLELNDNLTVPLLTGVALWLLHANAAGPG